MSTESVDTNATDDFEMPEEVWSRKFVQKDGLKHLFSIFLSGSLQTKYEDHWNEVCYESILNCVGYFGRKSTVSWRPFLGKHEKERRRPLGY